LFVLSFSVSHKADGLWHQFLLRCHLHIVTFVLEEEEGEEDDDEEEEDEDDPRMSSQWQKDTALGGRGNCHSAAVGKKKSATLAHPRLPT
jgi:hypothetical protein